MWTEPISREELAYFENALKSIPNEVDRSNPAVWPDFIKPFPTSSRSFLAIAGILADYADSQCWYNLAVYYEIIHSQSPTAQE